MKVTLIPKECDAFQWLGHTEAFHGPLVPRVCDPYWLERAAENEPTGISAQIAHTAKTANCRLDQVGLLVLPDSDDEKVYCLLAPGDWIVMEPDGNTNVFTDKEFVRNFWFNQLPKVNEKGNPA